jgi:hypothetical protein
MPIGAGLIITAADVADAVTPWATFAPTLWSVSTGARTSIAKTVTRAVWFKRAGFVVAEVDLTANASSASGASVSLPITASARQVVCGAAAIMGTAPPAQFNVALMSSSLDSIVVPTGTGAFTDIVSGQTFRYTVMYQA